MPSNELGAALPVVEVRRGDREGRHAGEGVLRRHVEQPDERAGITERQGPQQHRIDDAEDRRVGADAEREDADHREGERTGAEQDASGISKIGDKSAHEGVSFQDWMGGDG